MLQPHEVAKVEATFETARFAGRKTQVARLEVDNGKKTVITLRVTAFSATVDCPG